jgi:hypothetical protein
VQHRALHRIVQRISLLIQRIALLAWPDGNNWLDRYLRVFRFRDPIMFVSFFPRPLALTVSAALWGAFAISLCTRSALRSASRWDFTFKHLALRQSAPLCFGRRNSSGSISILS